MGSDAKALSFIEIARLIRLAAFSLLVLAVSSWTGCGPSRLLLDEFERVKVGFWIGLVLTVEFTGCENALS